jgi:predicted PurR-regulated permease PerM
VSFSFVGRPMSWWLGFLGAALFVGLTLYFLRGVLSPIFFSLTIAYLLDPLVDRFERFMPRAAAITLVLTILTLVGVAFLLLVLPGVIREVFTFVRDLPDELAGVVRQVEPFLREHDIPVPHTLDEAIEEYELAPAELASHAAAPLQAIGRFLLGGTMSAMSALASLVVIPVLAFYLLYDFDHMVAGGRDLIPARHRAKVVEIASEIDAVLGQFLRGQLLVMLAMAILYGVAYSLVGVRLAIPIALVAGLLAFIPYVGSGSALVMALLMCVVDWDGWTKPLLVVVAYAICQFLEGFVIVPKVVGDKVGLPAVWVLVALLIGGEVFGFLGVLLAVPVAAVVKIFVVRGLAWYRESELYLSGAPIVVADTAPLTLTVGEGAGTTTVLAAVTGAAATTAMPASDAAPPAVSDGEEDDEEEDDDDADE